jgi:hypothetical protein
MRTSNRLLRCTLALSLGLALAALLLWLSARTAVRADLPAEHIDLVGTGHAVAPAAAGAPGWSPPLNVSGWYTLGIGQGMRLKMGADGMQAAFWIQAVSIMEGAIFGAVCPPSGDWSAAENVTGWLTPAIPTLNPAYWSAGVGLDGTTWAVWSIVDPAQPGDNVRVKVGHRPPGGTWQTDDLSEWWHGTLPRAVDLHIGPDGDMAAIWAECASLANLSQGPCSMNVRRRLAGATTWETTERLDSLTGAGIAWPHVLVGPAGLTVVVWAEANPSSPSQWGVKARAYTPSSGWDSSVEDVSDGWLEPRYPNGDWLAQPVMDASGTFITAWTAKTSPGSANDAQYSATRAASTGNWSPPAQISVDHNAGALDTPWLAVGQDGTTIAAWKCEGVGVLANQYAIFANARDPGGTWSPAEVQVYSAWWDGVTLSDLGIWPDGTAVVLWQAVDTSRPATENEGVFWSARHGGTWGGGGQGQLGLWAEEVNGAALELGGDGSATAIWSIEDASQPVGEQSSVQVAAWPPGGPWGASEPLAAGYKSAFVWHEGLVAGQGGRPVAAVWWVMRDVVNPITTPSYAVFHSQWPEWRIYLPLVIRNHSRVTFPRARSDRKRRPRGRA